MIDLVTGATGFIGSHLAERLLAAGRRVRVLCRPESRGKLQPALAGKAEIVEGDLRDKDSMARAVNGATRIFHCAGHVLDWGAARDFDEANVRGTEWLFEAAADQRVERFIHFSSIAVFGTPSPPHMSDDAPFGTAGKASDAYTRTKIAGEQVAERFSKQGMNVVVLRPAVVYGPRGTWLEEPIAMIEKNRMFLLGGGVGTCHPCYIENLVDATVLAAEHPAAPGRQYIVGDDDPITFRRYFDGMAEIAGRPPITRSVPLAIARMTAVGMELGAKVLDSSSRPLLTRTALEMVTTKSTMSMQRIKTELGFVPRYDFARAVAELRAGYVGRSLASPAASSV